MWSTCAGDGWLSLCDDSRKAEKGVLTKTLLVREWVLNKKIISTSIIYIIMNNRRTISLLCFCVMAKFII